MLCEYTATETLLPNLCASPHNLPPSSLFLSLSHVSAVFAAAARHTRKRAKHSLALFPGTRAAIFFHFYSRATPHRTHKQQQQTWSAAATLQDTHTHNMPKLHASNETKDDANRATLQQTEHARSPKTHLTGLHAFRCSICQHGPHSILKLLLLPHCPRCRCSRIDGIDTTIAGTSGVFI